MMFRLMISSDSLTSGHAARPAAAMRATTPFKSGPGSSYYPAGRLPLVESAMAYRLLAVDLDGTLLRHDKTIDPTDIAAIRELGGAGVTVTIVTGRLHSGSVEAARACGIEGAIACVEGSHIVEADGAKTHHHHAIAPEVSRVVRDTLGAHGLASFIFERDGI